VGRDENGFGIFRYSGNRFRNFSIGFIGNGIFRKRNRFLDFLSEPVSESAWCFTDCFLRLPFFVGNDQICVSEFSGTVSEFFGIVSRNFSSCDFLHHLYVQIRITCFCIFGRFKIFWDRWCWKAVEINDLVFSTHTRF
jgi:hypothetical protein